LTKPPRGVFAIVIGARLRVHFLALLILLRIFPFGPISLIAPCLKIGLGALRQEHQSCSPEIRAGILEGGGGVPGSKEVVRSDQITRTDIGLRHELLDLDGRVESSAMSTANGYVRAIIAHCEEDTVSVGTGAREAGYT